MYLHIIVILLFVHYLVKETSDHKNNLRNGFLALKLVKKEILVRFLNPFIFLIWPPVAILDFTLYRELPKLLREAGELIL